MPVQVIPIQGGERASRFTCGQGWIEFAAFAVDDNQWGHALHLAVVGEINESEVLHYLEAALGPASKPKGIHHLESIPLLGIGKTDRIALAKMVVHE